MKAFKGNILAEINFTKWMGKGRRPRRFSEASAVIQVKGRESPAAGCAFATQSHNTWWGTSATVAERRESCQVWPPGGQRCLGCPSMWGAGCGREVGTVSLSQSVFRRLSSEDGLRQGAIPANIFPVRMCTRACADQRHYTELSWCALSQVDLTANNEGKQMQ